MCRMAGGKSGHNSDAVHIVRLPRAILHRLRMLTMITSITEHLAFIEQWDQSSCPNCSAGRMVYTGEESWMQAHFDGWQTYGVTFTESIWRHFAEIPLTLLYICDHCGFGRFYPVAEGTAEYYAAITAPGYYTEYRPEFTLARKMLNGRRGRLLEIGSGHGDFLRFLGDHGNMHEFHAVDSNPAVQNSLAKVAIVHSELALVEPGLDAVCAFQILP